MHVEYFECASFGGQAAEWLGIGEEVPSGAAAAGRYPEAYGTFGNQFRQPFKVDATTGLVAVLRGEERDAPWG